MPGFADQDIFIAESCLAIGRPANLPLPTLLKRGTAVTIKPAQSRNVSVVFGSLLG